MADNKRKASQTKARKPAKRLNPGEGDQATAKEFEQEGMGVAAKE